ncbi:MAG: metallophosphoesterase [Candidatus Roizmanbacteria bacterium]|nr:metallophosphoesterase [Candidatus Roizmanbacteria bacterium]
MNNTIRFIHISDTHIGPTKDFELYKVKPYPCAEQMVDYLNNLKDKPDFIVHTGDVAATIPDDPSFKNAREIFSKLNYPIYYVTGNHDRSSFIIDYLKQGERESLVSDSAKNAYRFDMNRIRFITLDARGPDEIDPHGSLSEDQFKALEQEITTGLLPLVIFVHYPPIALDSPWLDKNMLILEGDRLHELFKKAGKRLLGIFIGHIHRGMQIVKDGVFYSSVGSTFMQFAWYPTQEEPVMESTGLSYFNYVIIDGSQITVKEYSIPNGNVYFLKSRRELA